MVVSLVEGRDFVDRFPSWAELENHSKRQKDDFSLAFCAHNYMRAFLFHSFDGVVESEGLIARLEPQSSVRVERTPLRPLFLIGVSFTDRMSERVFNLIYLLFRFSTRVFFSSTWHGYSSTKTSNSIYSLEEIEHWSLSSFTPT